jgi:hypothetical protein
VWQRVLPRLEAEALAPQFQVISSRLTHGQTMLRVFNEQAPEAGFVRAVPDLEDVYFTHIHGYAQ